MLYCPKCQSTYKDGTQRFCTNEGARLLPSPVADQSEQPSKGVFTNILNKSNTKPEKKQSEVAISAFHPPVKSKFFNAEDKSVEESNPSVSEIIERKEETGRSKTFEHIPLANLIKPDLLEEKQKKFDKIFNKQKEKPAHTDLNFSVRTQNANDDILEPFETNKPDLLEVDERENSILMENAGEIESAFDEELELPEIPANEDELDYKTSESNFEKSEGEFEPNSVEIDEKSQIAGSEPDFILDLDEPLETFASNDEIENSVISESLPEIELDLAELDEVSVPSKIELDLESRKKINLADSIPRIELDLAELDEVSIPQDVGEEPEFVQEIGKISDSFDPGEQKSHPSREVKNDISEILQSSLPAVVSPVAEKDNAAVNNWSENSAQTKTEKNEDNKVVSGAEKENAVADTTWEKRSSDATVNEKSKWFLYPLIGLIVLGIGLLGFFYLNNQNNSVNQQNSNNQIENQKQSNANSDINSNANVSETNINSNANLSADGSTFNPNSQDFPVYSDYQGEPRSDLSAVPPLPRKITQPPNTVYYKNDKQKQRGVLADKFLGFSIYYPKDWKQAKSNNDFLDIAKKTPNGLPIKQLLITRYDSNGTFDADRPIFDELVEKSNNDLRDILSNYEVISKGEGTFQNGRWRVYEVKFQGIGSDKKLIIWGRRLWIPVQRQGMKSGFIITMIGTSLSNDVKSVEDLGEKDDLAEILKTFEPELN